MEIVAHRGASLIAPDNTLAAIDRAFLLGADGVEFDVFKDRHGTLFLLHDETLDKVTGVDRTCPAALCPSAMTQSKYNKSLYVDVSTLSYEDFIKHVKVGAGKGDEFADETPPLLKTVLDSHIPDGKFAMVEIKTVGANAPTAEDIAKVVKANSWSSEKVRFESFDLELVKKIKQELGEYQVYNGFMMGPGWENFGYLGSDAFNAEVDKVAAAGLDGINAVAIGDASFDGKYKACATMGCDFLTPDRVAYVRNKNLKLATWVSPIYFPLTDTHRNRMHMANDLGVDQFQTDLP